MSKHPLIPYGLLIDADTANEIDDLYAIARCLVEPGLNIVGLTAAQWHHRLSPPDTVARSQALNEQLLAAANRTDIPALPGAEMIMGKPWGGSEPSDSPAAQFIIETARAVPAGQKLTIAAQGALTNVASAIALAPDIISKVALYLMGTHYDPPSRIWNKSEFNARNDLNALDFVFNAEGLEVHVMATNPSRELVFERDATYTQLAGTGPLGECLANRWREFAPDNRTWIMWDLALIEALLRPELACEKRILPPPENAQREIFVYTEIDILAMREDFWRALHSALASE